MVRRCMMMILCLLGAFNLAQAASDMELFYQAIDWKTEGKYQDAAQVWQKLANNGHARSQFYLGLLYDEGLGLKQSDKQALFWYEKAAQQHLADAWMNIGNILVRQKYYHRALATYQRASELGHAPATDNRQTLLSYLSRFQLTTLVSTSLRQTPNVKGAVLRTLDAGVTGYEVAKQGRWIKVSLAGQPDVGWLPLDKVLSPRVLYEQAVKQHTFGHANEAAKIWERLAKAGHGKSQIMLARMYLDGDGVSKNYEQAIFWSEKALAQGDLSDKVRDFTKQTIRLAKKRMSDYL